MDDRKKGIFYIVLAALFSTLMTLCIRMAGDLPSFQKTLFRNVIAMVVSFAAVRREGVSLKVRRGDLPLILLRAALGTAAMFGSYYAADHLILADASILGQLSPFFALLFSWLILHERATLTHGLFAMAAFAGAALIIKPAGNMVNLGALAGIIGGVTTGISYTLIRLLGKRGVSGSVIIFYFSVFAFLSVLPPVILGYQPMTLDQICWLVGVGLCATAVQFTTTKAYCYAPANEISIFSYTQILFSAVTGFLLLGQTPDIRSILGYCVVAGSAIGMYRYNLRLSRGVSPET